MIHIQKYELSINFKTDIQHLSNSYYFFWRGGKMAKSFKDVVQDSPRTCLGIPVKTKKPPLSNQYTARGTAFRL